MDVNAAMQVSEEAGRRLAQEVDLFMRIVPPEMRTARVHDAMGRAGFLPGGQFQFAPPADRQRALEAYQRQDDEVLGRSVADITDAVRLLSDLFPMVEAAVMEPPSPATLIMEMRKTSVAPEGPLVAELLEATLERDVPARVAGMTVREAADAYERALEAPRKPINGALICAIEARVLAGVPPFRDERGAVDRLAGLSQLVRQTREGRLPERLKAVRAAVEQGSKAIQLARAGNIRAGASVEQAHLRQLQKVVKG
jgi:hypothetical protein